MGTSVTVVIPMFNAEPWISSTLMSVVTQTHSVSEIVVVNDGSTDNSASKAESVLASFGIDYQVATIPNGGVSRARNLGASIAAGEVLCFLDADDLWEPDKVLKQLELLESAELQACSCAYQITDESGLVQREVHFPWTEEAVTRWVALQSYGGALASTLMIRKSHFQNLRGFDEQLGLAADMDLALKLTRSTLVGAICEPLVSYRTHSGQMHQNLDQVIREHSYVIANSFDDPKVQRQLLSDLAVYADLKRIRSEHSLRNAVSAAARVITSPSLTLRSLRRLSRRDEYSVAERVAQL